MKQILIKTEMTEMPKGCKDCIKARSSGGKLGVANFWCSETGKTIVFYGRPEYCPLVEHIVDDNKTIGEEK